MSAAVQASVVIPVHNRAGLTARCLERVLADLPGGWIYSSPPAGWGPVPLEAWTLAGVLYIAGVAVTRAVARDIRPPLGFAGSIPSDDAAAGTPVDLAAPSAR